MFVTVMEEIVFS